MNNRKIIMDHNMNSLLAIMCRMADRIGQIEKMMEDGQMYIDMLESANVDRFSSDWNVLCTHHDRMRRFNDALIAGLRDQIDS
jgi:hypothetical protein